MKIIYATNDISKIKKISQFCKDIEVLTLSDIGYNLLNFDSYGKTLEEISLNITFSVYGYSLYNNINYPIITDVSGLYVDALNGNPGINTDYYADDDIKRDPTLPSYQSVFKLLKNMEDVSNRNATYKSVVTCMLPNGTYFQETAESLGKISKAIMGNVEKPYFHSIFMLKGLNKIFSELTETEKKETYRYKALTKVLKTTKK